MADSDFSSLSFLVVDDNVSILELVAHKLKKLGIAGIHTANNGRAALEKLHGISPTVDVIICDLNMPEMDGIQFLRHLAQENYSGGIIILSGVNRNILRSAHRLAREHSLKILGSLSKEVEIKEIHKIISHMNLAMEAPIKKKQSPISLDELNSALEGQQLDYVYQPKIHINDKKISGVEVLTRWNHPVYGEISPVQFIHLAEGAGLIDRMTRIVSQTAIQQVRQWLGSGIAIRVSVNATAASLENLEFADFLIDLAKEENVPCNNLIIEVTETQLMRNLSAHLETLTRLGMSGFGLSIDDFGKGYSTLEQLERIPFTELKIPPRHRHPHCYT